MRITSHEELADVVDAYLLQPAFAFDVETMPGYNKPTESRGNPRLNRVVWLSLATAGRADVLALGHPNGDFIRYDFPTLPSGRLSQDKRKATMVFEDAPPQLHWGAETTDILKRLFFSDRLKIGHNIKFDLGSIAKHFGGAIPSGPYADTLVGSWVIDSSRAGSLKLNDCADRELGYRLVKGVGKNIEEHSFTDVEKYSFIDAKATWLIRQELEHQLQGSLRDVFNLEMQVLEVLVRMEAKGARVDTEALRELDSRLREEILAAEVAIYRAAGRSFNINSNKEKIDLLFGKKREGGRGLKPPRTTATGSPSVDAQALEVLALRGDDLAVALTAYAGINKLHGTYVVPYLGGEVTRTTGGKSKVQQKESLLVGEHLHTDFVQYGTETGRFSCVSGDTLLSTNRGTFTFESYMPVEGDRVLTHTGHWMPVLRKIYKGVDQMFQVRLENGSVLHCTMDHRLLTSRGWSRLGDLAIGDPVASYGRIEVLRQQLRESPADTSCVHCSGQTNISTGGPATGDYVPQCAPDPRGGSQSGTAEGGTGSSILPLEGGGLEPYAGQEWFPTPQLCRPCEECRRIYSGEGREEVRTGASEGSSRGVGHRDSPARDGCSPSGWGQDEQSTGESGFSDQGGTSQIAHVSSRLVEVTALGAMGVWDIEVGGDHSYLSQGFVNHNSRNPNLQQVPSPRTPHGKAIRGLYVAEPGYALVVADYAQVEPRVMADLSQDPSMLEAFHTNQDIYTALAAPFGLDRSAGKVLVLSVAYGTGPEKLAATVGMSEVDANKVINRDFPRAFPQLIAHKSAVIAQARRQVPVPCVVTPMGRRRFLPDLAARNWQRKRAERQAYNTMIQGTAADINKMAIVAVDRLLTQHAPRAHIILTIHDELVVQAPHDEAEKVLALVREGMEGVKALSTVSLIAEAKIVHRWSEAK